MLLNKRVFAETSPRRIIVCLRTSQGIRVWVECGSERVACEIERYCGSELRGFGQVLVEQHLNGVVVSYLLGRRATMSCSVRHISIGKFMLTSCNRFELVWTDWGFVEGQLSTMGRIVRSIENLYSACACIEREFRKYD